MRRAIDAHHLKHEYVAVHCLGYSGAHLSQQLADVKPFLHGDLMRLPIEVRLSLSDAFDIHLGLPLRARELADEEVA